MKWFTVSISDSVRALDSQSAVAIFLTNLKRQTPQSIIDGYEVEVEEDDAEEDKE